MSRSNIPKFRICIGLFLGICLGLGWILSQDNVAHAGQNTYTFTVTRADARLLDDVVAGVEMEITCVRTDPGSGRTGQARISLYAPTTDFAAWPPTLSEFRQYVVSYLRQKIKNKRRLDSLMDESDEPVVSHAVIESLLGREITITR